MKDPNYGDRVIENAMDEATGWIQAGEAINAVNSGITALKRVAKELSQADFSTMKPEVAARTAAYIAKMVDEVARLIEFSQGKADSRPDPGLGELLKLLTDKQFETFGQWIDEAKASGRLAQ